MTASLRIPTAFSFSKIRPEATAEQLAALNSLLPAPVAVGDANPFLQELMDLAFGGGSFVRAADASGMASCELQTTEYITLSVVGVVCAVGGDVLGLPRFFALTAEQYAAELPAAFPSRERLVADPDNPDADPAAVVAKWNDWAANSPRPDLAPVLLGDTWYVANQNPYDRGTILPASTWIGSGLTVVTPAEYAVVAEAASPGE